MQSKITMKFDSSLDGFSTSWSSWIETKTDVDTLKILKKGVN